MKIRFKESNWDLASNAIKDSIRSREADINEIKDVEKLLLFLSKEKSNEILLRSFLNQMVFTEELKDNFGVHLNRLPSMHASPEDAHNSVGECILEAYRYLMLAMVTMKLARHNSYLDCIDTLEDILQSIRNMAKNEKAWFEKTCFITNHNIWFFKINRIDKSLLGKIASDEIKLDKDFCIDLDNME